MANGRVARVGTIPATAEGEEMLCVPIFGLAVFDVKWCSWSSATLMLATVASVQLFYFSLLLRPLPPHPPPENNGRSSRMFFATPWCHRLSTNTVHS